MNEAFVEAGQWLILTDYASKYRVSVSTLRRRIKHQQIRFRVDGGRYLIFDAPPKALENVVAASNTMTFPGLHPLGAESATVPEVPPIASASSQTPDSTFDPMLAHDEPILSSATKLLSELKRAYMNILHEKEEQIIQLKEEVSDLKTLVRVLEEDNDRMRRFLKPTGHA